LRWSGRFRRLGSRRIVVHRSHHNRLSPGQCLLQRTAFVLAGIAAALQILHFAGIAGINPLREILQLPHLWMISRSYANALKTRVSCGLLHKLEKRSVHLIILALREAAISVTLCLGDDEGTTLDYSQILGRSRKAAGSSLESNLVRY